uniref:beta-N-acetylhexosaminidase n=1 Tax=uncultured Flavobacteriia bacterium TaxID=212695 RepID=H6RIB5_9BACT|nr:beta-N-acetylglucosaminidase, glycoside hydrolase family GH3 [uncultured bacterium]CCG00861.1 beta-N-acetylglucosaminidase glycoside hydrolase family 3 protein [uncultured Flavobacteriia bacterium]|tara:strand:- start:27639 stop:30557 length:2919 start_codon:yes stop_codon:yes gene_type:complete
MKKCLLTLLLSSFIFISAAQRKDPLRTTDFEVQEIWVDSIANGMSLEEKIGQLFMVQAYSNADTKHQESITEMIRKYHVGGLIFMQGTPEKQAFLTNKYQATAKVPLLIGFDGEWGLDMRLKNTYRFPWNMTLGAIKDNSLIKQFGKYLGQHAKRIGIHINFAPVIDINVDPENPIIGNRSFGENKLNVTEKAIAFIKGMQGEGVLANGKHFPGHGDTSADSHHTLPLLNFDKMRLDSIELYPYKKTFDAGLTSVMTAHLNIPSLEPDINLPTSLSKSVVTNLLQEQLGFQGLIITDGLNMKGAANYASSAEINLAAIIAGNDLLLIPQEIPASIGLIKEALSSGKLTQKRIDLSVRKILKAKYWAGLHAYEPIVLENIVEELNRKQDEVLHRELVQNSLTLLKNTAAVFPIRNLDSQKIAYVKLGDAENDAHVNMLKNYAEITVVSDTSLKGIVEKLKPFDLVVIGFHKSNINPWKSYKFTKKELRWLQVISKKNTVILEVFTSPYSLLKIKNFKDIEGIIVSYQNSKLAQEISAQLLFGAIVANGKLPVSIQTTFKEGSGIVSTGLSRFEYTIPEAVGMSSNKLALLDKLADTIITEKMAPGFQILVARNGKVVLQKSYGYHTQNKINKVKNTDLYDVASLTKILATLPLLMKAEEEQRISLTDQVVDIFPRFRNTNKAAITVKEMLSHTAKLKAWIPFYKATQDSLTGENLSSYYRTIKSKEYRTKVAENLFLKSNYKDSIYKYIKFADQREEEGYKYSDLGYYLLKEALEDSYKKPLNTLVDVYFYKPLGANRTGYLPLERFSKKDIVPTEKDNYYRNQLLHGNVHDMGAAMLGGVGGHAGVFANANDVGKIMQLYLQKGFYGGKRYLKSETINKFNQRYFSNEKVRRGLGFDKPQLDPDVKATCGCVSEESFGHSGFTGTYTWADPVSGLVYVFLSNRVHPNMENRGLIERNMRTKIQQVIQDAILD